MSLIRQNKIQDGTDDSLLAGVNASGELSVVNASLPLPAGASTEAKQDTQITNQGTINTSINAVETNQTDKSQFTKLTDGTDDGSITTNADDTDNLDGEKGLIVNAVQYMRLNSDTVSPLRADASTHSLQTMDYEHHEIHAGSHFLICSVQDLSINHVYDVQITTPDTTKWAHMTFSLECESETLWELYENVTINLAGTTITAHNNDRNSGTTSTLTFAGISNTSTANANTDTAVAGATLIETGIIGTGKKSLGSDSRNKEIILKQNEDYTLRFTATAAGYTDFCLQWYEHTNKD